MTKLYVWEEIPVPAVPAAEEGYIRHRVDQKFIDGKPEPGGIDKWERRRDRFAPGDRIMSFDDMGDYELGIYMRQGSGMVLMKIDGVVYPDGTRHEPYLQWVNADYVDKISDGGSGERDMREGYRPIPATL